MTQKEILALVRKLIADEQATGYTEGGNLEMPEGTQELLNYLDRAVDAYSERQVAAGDLRLMKRMAGVDGAPLPKDFLSFCGLVPVSVEGGVMRWYGAPSKMPVRYFARLPYVTDHPSGALPYENDQERTIAALAAIYALNKHEFNISQDLMLLGMGGGGDAPVQ